MRAAMLSHAGSDYHQACMQMWQSSIPLVYFMLPTMHQTLELLVKAVAFLVDHDFEPKNYRHRTLDVIQKYAKQAAVFQKILADPEAIKLVEELQKSYFLVRYGEAALTYSGDDWKKYVEIAKMLAEHLDEKFQFHIGI